MCKGLGEPLGVCEEGEYIILSADMCSRAYTSYAVAAASSLVQHTQHLLANSSTLQVHPTVLWACGVVVLNRTLLEIAAATPQSRRTIVYIVDDYEFALHTRLGAALYRPHVDAKIIACTGRDGAALRV